MTLKYMQKAGCHSLLERRHGIFRGPAAILAHDNIVAVRQLDFEDLGMEAVREIDVQDFPAFIVVDDKATIFSPV